MTDGVPPAEAHRDSVRRTILILAAAGFASALTTRFVDPMIGVIARDLGADPLRVALLSSAYALPYALVQPVLGPVGDALGKERVVKVLLAILFVTLAAASLAPNLPVLFAARVMSGLAAGGIIPIALATIGDRTAMAERQVAISRFLIFTISGQLLGSSLAGLLSGLLGWRGVFGAAAFVAAAAAVAVVLGFSHSRVAPGGLSLSGAMGRYRHIFGIGKARALMLFVFTEGVFIFGAQPYIAPLLERHDTGAAREAGIIIAGFAAGGMVYTLSVTWLLRTLGLARMLVVAGLMGLGAFGAIAGNPAWTVWLAAMTVMGCAFYMLHNSFQTQMTEVVPDARASAIAMHAFSYFLGQAIGPALFGEGLFLVGPAPTMLACGASVLALGIVSAGILAPRR